MAVLHVELSSNSSSPDVIKDDEILCTLRATSPLLMVTHVVHEYIKIA